MAEVSAHEHELRGIKHLLWGNDVKPDIFRRWSQGFYFSHSEKSALEQLEGGPCSIIAPVQAFIMKKLLQDYDGLNFREIITEEIQNKILVNAVCDILKQCSDQKYYVVHINSKIDFSESDPNINGSSDTALIGQKVLNPEKFHELLRIRTFSTIDNVERYYTENINLLKDHFGVLLFLYSVITTKGLEHVKLESDTSEPLIDETYGYGSQSLINLMITGRAVTYVWDNEQDVGGLKLKGLDKQSQIGFITSMEHLRYCTVGSFYKNPVHPIWVLGSETHLTGKVPTCLLFSDDRKLVSPETRSEQARRVFKSFDRDGNNFISGESLKEVLKELDLVDEEGYVEIMRRKLDSENLGIILLNAFMDEFFPKEESSTPDMFTLVHYNGLAQSNINGQVNYHVGSAILLESTLSSICESNPMLTCLQTKWPNIDINWYNNVTPSLN